jgi:ubiquinone/menaquinone biosynthesis C-methylase UbiE
MSEPGSEATRRVGALFDVVADSYDAVGVPFFHPIAESLLRVMPPQPGERWLDVGCGRGAVLLQVAPAVCPAVVVGTDISTGMLDNCRRLVKEAGLDNVELVLDDAQEPAVPGAFDTLSSSLVLFFLPDPAGALRRWLPLVAPGGRIGVTTFGEIDPRWVAVSEVFTPYLPPDVLDARTSGTRGPFASDAGMEELLADAGWTDVRTVRDEVDVRFESPEHWRRFSLGSGQRRMWMSVPPDRRDAVRDEAFALLAKDADADGSVTFWQRIRHTLARRPEEG